jgi:hypothetical protein
MDIAKAIIAGIATILSAVITLLIKDRQSKAKYQKIEPEVSDAIYGKWKGTVQHELGNSLQIHVIDLELKVSGSGVITGKASFSHNSESYLLMLSGGFYSLRFIKVNYENISVSLR